MLIVGGQGEIRFENSNLEEWKVNQNKPQISNLRSMNFFNSMEGFYDKLVL